MLIDTHCHFDMMPNPELFISDAEKKGDIILGMTNLPSHFVLGKSHMKGLRNVRLALGFHPQLASDFQQELSLFDRYIDNTSYIGEIGLDFSRNGISTKDIQISSLRHILETLRGKNKIISVHSRKAEFELLSLLSEYDINNVIFHWYSGGVELIPQLLQRGYYFSINESMILTAHGRKIIDNIPFERILTETDAPYNEHSSIKNLMQYIGLTEDCIYHNFMNLVNRIK